MRIRTVKPEFWSHPMTGRWPGDLQALAIGALNMADDEGYFRADPMLVRAALRPFDDDSSNVRRGLDELSRTGWIEVREHSDDGAIARVRNFAKHQKIDRPQPSKLRQLFETSPFVERSTNDRRAFVEPSLLEQGTGNRDQGTDLLSSSPEAAPSTDTLLDVPPSEPDDVTDVWEHWRVTLGHPRAVLDAKRKRLIKERLKAYSVEDLQRAIDGCAANRAANPEMRAYDGIGLILRDSDKVEMFMNMRPR